MEVGAGVGIVMFHLPDATHLGEVGEVKRSRYPQERSIVEKLVHSPGRCTNHQLRGLIAPVVAAVVGQPGFVEPTFAVAQCVAAEKRVVASAAAVGIEASFSRPSSTVPFLVFPRQEHLQSPVRTRTGCVLEGKVARMECDKQTKKSSSPSPVGKILQETLRKELGLLRRAEKLATVLWRRHRHRGTPRGVVLTLLHQGVNLPPARLASSRGSRSVFPRCESRWVRGCGGKQEGKPGELPKMYCLHHHSRHRC